MGLTRCNKTVGFTLLGNNCQWWFDGENSVPLQLSKQIKYLEWLPKFCGYIKGNNIGIYKTLLLRPYPEYCIPVWNPYLIKDVKLIEGVQRRATKIVQGIPDWKYDNRLNYFDGRPTQPSILPGSVSEYQLRLGRQRQVCFIPLADERGLCNVQVKLWDPLRTRAIPERLRGVFLPI